MARLYRLLTVFKLFRVIKNQKILEALQIFLHFPHDTKQIVYSFIRMVFLLHVIGCLWAAIATLTFDEIRVNWVRDQGMLNESIIF